MTSVAQQLHLQALERVPLPPSALPEAQPQPIKLQLV